MFSAMSLPVCAYAKLTQQPMAGRVTLYNEAREEIKVSFYATRVKKNMKPACRPFRRTIAPGESKSIHPKNCSINVIEVRHTPEEEYEQTTKEFLSFDDQATETFWVYQGPNRIVQMMFKSR